MSCIYFLHHIPYPTKSLSSIVTTWGSTKIRKTTLGCGFSILVEVARIELACAKVWCTSLLYVVCLVVFAFIIESKQKQ